MTKFILLGLVIWLAIYVLKRVVNQSNSQPSNTPAPSDNESENMVQCATCKVHLPRSEAFLVNSNFYCSKAHIPNS
ncbi:MAG: PP0621 family protein [Methylotenera sp.]|nr:PP0621 family protein [Methylotenera sp.]